MLGFTEPVSRGRSGGLPRPNTDAIAPASTGSPVGVPVPWAST